MLTLNLLPEHQKKEIKLEYTFRKTLFLGISIIVALGIFTLFALGTKLILQNKFEETEKKIEAEFITAELLQIKEKEKVLDKFNQLLSTIKEISELRTHWSEVLIKITEDIPEGVELTQIIIDQKGKVSLAGFSPTREKVLVIKDTLESSPQFKDIYSPRSNLVKKENIDFFFSFKLK